MTFYLLRDGNEVGPFSWVEIYVLLQKGELAYSDLVRCEDDSDYTPIEALGFWNEGSDVGPLTWDDILLLRSQANLEDEVVAKIEGEGEFSTLQQLLDERPELVAESSQRSMGHWLPFAAAALLIFTLGFWLFFTLPSEPDAEKSSSLKNSPAISAQTVHSLQAEHTVEQTKNLPPQTPESQPSQMDLSLNESILAVISKVPSTETSAMIETSTILPGSLPSPRIETATISPVTAYTPVESPASPTIASSLPPEQPPTSTTASPTPTPDSLVKPSENLTAAMSNFFQIHSIKLLTRTPRDSIGVWTFEKGPRGQLVAKDFVRCLEMEVSAKDNIAAKDVFAKAYFFDNSGKLLATAKAPSKAGNKTNAKVHYSMPVLFSAETKVRLFFEIPSDLGSSGWRAVVVFGDKEEAKAMAYPFGSSYAFFEFPEKQLVNDRSSRKVRRKKVADRLVEYVQKTRNPKHPQITFFLRPPKGIQDWSEVKGIYALVVLSNSVEKIRRRMQADELDGDESGTFAFANKHKLAILVWGSRRIWDPRRNHDEYDRRDARELDRNFDAVADAWEKAVLHFHKEYGTPLNNFILKGNCGAAQWAKRLCLRKPDYFLATHIHLAGSYDKPTPEAAKVLWCVTTTERDGGYERSKRFLNDCKELGYPIVYKAATPQSGIGRIGDQFFEYAMTFKEQRAEYDKQAASQSSLQASKTSPSQPWPEPFANPQFYGDVVNQEVFPASEVDMIPEVFRSAIPTKKLADVWNRK